MRSWKKSIIPNKIQRQDSILLQNPSISYNSIIIFDWDDTLFSTTHLCPNNKLIKLTKDDISDLDQQQQIVVKILNYYKDKGDLYIITNSSQEWLNFSSKTFAPRVHELLKELRIVSARDLFEKEYINDTRQWKISTFTKMKSLYCAKKVTNILCFGDSEIELESAHILGKAFKEAYIKTVKFKKGPTLQELTKQLKIVYKSRKEILNVSKNWVISIEKKRK